MLHIVAMFTLFVGGMSSVIVGVVRGARPPIQDKTAGEHGFNTFLLIFGSICLIIFLIMANSY